MDMGKTQLSSCALPVLGMLLMSVHCKADDVYLAQHHAWLQFATNKHRHYSKIAMFIDCMIAFAFLLIFV